MKRKRHNPEQIIRKLRSAKQLLNQGQSVGSSSTAACRRSRPEAMDRDFRIVVGSKGIGRATQDGVQQLQTALGSPGAYVPGSVPAMEGGLTNPFSSHRNWTTDGGHGLTTRGHLFVPLHVSQMPQSATASSAR